MQCAGITKGRTTCRITSCHPHAGAQPLRDGEHFCKLHAAQATAADWVSCADKLCAPCADESCAACGVTEHLTPDPDADDVLYCDDCWSWWNSDA